MRNNILIIESSNKKIDLLKNLIYREFSRKKTIIHTSIDIESSLNVVENYYIDLIIINLSLNSEKILETLIKINNLTSDRQFKIPLLIYNGLRDKHIIKKSFELGAIDYFFDKLESEDISYLFSLKIKNSLKICNYNNNLIKENNQNKKQLKLANILQKSLMINKKVLPSIEVFGRYIPSTEIGGDSYDAIDTDGKTWFMIADVMGHGASAAMVSFMVKALFNQLANIHKTPKTLLNEINRTYYKMFENKSDIIFSIFVGTIYKNKLTYSSAGHPYPIFYNSQDKTTYFLDNNNILIGIVPHSNFSQKSQMISKGDIIYLYTDGLYEQIPEMRDINLINNYIKLNHKLLINSPDIFTNNIIKEFTNNEEIEDDIAILALKKK